MFHERREANQLILRNHQVVIDQTNYTLYSGRAHLSDTYVVITLARVMKCVGLLSTIMDNHISGVKSKESI